MEMPRLRRDAASPFWAGVRPNCEDAHGLHSQRATTATSSPGAIGLPGTRPAGESRHDLDGRAPAGEAPPKETSRLEVGFMWVPTLDPTGAHERDGGARNNLIGGSPLRHKPAGPALMMGVWEHPLARCSANEQDVGRDSDRHIRCDCHRDLLPPGPTVSARRRGSQGGRPRRT
jgi:hypothetical protein